MIVNEPENATGGKADGWFTPLRFVLLLMGVVVARFPRVMLGQETFFYRDYGLFTYPVAHYFRECFWRGELPLWNPLNDFGVPFLAQWNTTILYPPSLFFLILPLTWSLAVFNLAHLVFAGLGMYLLARRWTGSQLAASVAGAAFAFNGLSLQMLVWISNLAAWAWMPWVVLAVERAWSAKRGMGNNPARLIALAVLAGAMQMLAGAPEIILLTWLLLGLLWLGQWWRGIVPRRQMFQRVAVVVLLVAGLSAAQLLPFWTLLSHSQRSPGFTNSDWSMPLSGPANFLVPLFHCFEAGQGVFVQYGQYWVASHYLGAGLMVLAVMGALCVRQRRVWLLLGLAVFSIWMALGAPGLLYTLVAKVMPLLGVMRYPIKFVVLAGFTIPLLAAYGVHWYQAQVAGGDAKKARRMLQGVALTLLALMAVIVWLAWKHPMVKDDWNATWQNALGRALFVVMIPGLLILVERVPRFKLRVLLGLALLVLLCADVFTHALNMNPTVRSSVYEPGLIRLALKMSSQARPDEPRFMETEAALQKLHVTSLSNPADQYLCQRLALYDNCNLLDDVSKSDGFYSLYLREPMHALSLVFMADALHQDAGGLKDFLGIGHVSASGADSGKLLDWAARETALPLVTAGQRPVFASDADTDAGLMAAKFEPRQTVYLPLEARSDVKAGLADAKIISPQIEAQRVQFEVQANAPAMVVVAQAFYEPWHAYVDGKRVRLWRANAGFQALEVSAGRHTVKLVYEDRAFQCGMAISLASLLAVGMGWFWPVGKRPGSGLPLLC